jgi:hypothetical protein
MGVGRRVRHIETFEKASMRFRRIIRFSIWTLVSLFLLMNVIAYFHAYKFTHFDSSLKVKTKDAAHLSASQKIKTLIFGVSNSRPENNILPSHPFETVYLKSNKSGMRAMMIT